MPIVYVHGVATRDPHPPVAAIKLMRAYLGPAIAGSPAVHVEYAYWGDAGATFAWQGAARPRSPLLGMGADTDISVVERVIRGADIADAMRNLPRNASPARSDSLLIPAGPNDGPPATTDRFRLRDLGAQELSDLLVAYLIANSPADDERLADLLVAADEVSHAPETPVLLARQSDLDGEEGVLAAAIERRVASQEVLIGMGGVEWHRLFDRLGETIDRGVGIPGHVVSRLVAEFREPVNRSATLFVGDVLAYLDRRGTAHQPGRIPIRFLTALRAARDAAPPEEPLVVISHSMGGQIVYDAVTTWLPGLPEFRKLRIDFWCATASQVGLFEELKLFLASSPAIHAPHRVDFPPRAHLGGWWNVWDHNDFISYTAAPIFSGVDDESYDSGMTLIGAHSGYLQRPSFYRRFADKLQKAAESEWYR